MIAIAGGYHVLGCDTGNLLHPFLEEDTVDTSAKPTTDDITVYFLDVGQGDSILIQASDATILIDGSERDQGSIVLEDLKKYGVTTIDYLIASHPHADHIGGLIDVLNYAAEQNDLTIQSVYMADIPDSKLPTTRTYEQFLDGIEANSITPDILSEPKTISIGEHTTMQLIPPAKMDYSSLNDFSLCTYIDCNGTTFLFTGDAENDEEADLLESGWLEGIQADVFKAGHHGSRTSSSEALLEHIQPSYVVISCGTDNSYGHPHEEAMTRLQSYTNTIYRTDLDGTVVCTVTDQNMKWSFDQ